MKSISGKNPCYWLTEYPFKVACVDLEYSFLGKRTYIQGIIGLHGMLRALDFLTGCVFKGNSYINMVKIKEEIKTFTRAEAFCKEDIMQHPFAGEEIARADFSVEGEDYVGLLFPYRDATVETRDLNNKSGGHIDKLYESEEGVTGEIRGVFDYIDLIRAIEEVHRDSILNKYSSRCSKIRWVYLEDMIVFSPEKSTCFDRVLLYENRVFRYKNGFFDYRRGLLNGKYGFGICFYFEF